MESTTFLISSGFFSTEQNKMDYDKILTEHRIVTTPDDLLLLLEPLATNIASLLSDSTGSATATNTKTQAERAWWTPPPIPSCWWSRSCERDERETGHPRFPLHPRFLLAGGPKAARGAPPVVK